MSDMIDMNIQLPSDLADRFDSFAKNTRQSKSACVAEAIRIYLERESTQIEAIQEGIRHAESGRFVDHEKVLEWVESWDTDEEKARPVMKP
jgi:RHH-type transcriptional regulator, rel operon repressor / antitoxin RelB